MTHEDDSPDLGFRYVERRGGRVEITRHGRTVLMLAGARAERFLRQAASADLAAQQQAMAKATGQYKFGNERSAREHRRNRE